MNRRIERGRASHSAGLRAEFWAALLLMIKGYHILARRMKTHAGEIDLIAKRGGTLVFVEVKSRNAKEAAAEALSERQRERLARAAELYLAMHPKYSDMTVRFDVILAGPKRWPQHLIDAWRPY